MALFYFALKAGRKTFPDTEGQEFEDEAEARAHARTVARELMRNRQAKTGHWRIQVCDDYLKPSFECLFADVDQALEMLPAELRASVTAVARTAAAVNDAYQCIGVTMADLQETMGRMDFLLSRL